MDDNSFLPQYFIGKEANQSSMNYVLHAFDVGLTVANKHIAIQYSAE